MKRQANQEELNTRAFKKIRAFLAKAIKAETVTEMDVIEYGFTATILKEGNVEVTVPLPASYQAAIMDPVYGPKWREAIQEELKALSINGT